MSTLPDHRAPAIRPAEAAVVVLALACGVWLYLGPSLRSLGSSLGPDLGDPRLNLYIVTWVAESARRGFSGLWSPPLFFPSSGTLAISDHLIGPGLVVWLGSTLGIPPVATFNYLFLASFVLVGVSTHLLLRRLGASTFSSALVSWSIAFSHQRWDEISHYQVLRAQWIPGVLWSFDRFLAAPRPGSGVLFLGLYLLHVSGGTYLTFMIHVPMLVILLVRASDLARLVRARPTAFAVVGATGVASATLLALFVQGYFAEWGEQTLPRHLTEVRTFGPVLASLWAPSFDSLVSRLGILAPGGARGALFPGFVVLAGWAAFVCRSVWRRLAALRPGSASKAAAALAFGVALALWGMRLADAFTLDATEWHWLAGSGFPRYNGPRAVVVLGCLLVYFTWRWSGRAAGVRRRDSDPFVRALLIGGALCLWLAFPAGFTMLSAYVPGMSGIRVCHRFALLAAFALAFPAARGLDVLLRGSRRRRLATLAAIALAGVALLEATPRRWTWAPVPSGPESFPEYARVLAATPGVGAYLELPAYLDYRDGEWMLNQTLHWKPLVNGYSARIPESYESAASLFAPFPSRAGLERLRSMGVTHLVVHWPPAKLRGRFSWPGFRRMVVGAKRRGQIATEYETEEVSIYRLVHARAAEGPSPRD